MATTESTIRINRAHKGKQNPYFQQLRATAQDKELDYDALGMLTYLLSKPDNWLLKVKDLMRPGCKRAKVYRILRDLRAARYAALVEVRHERGKKKGQIKGYEYLIYEEPLPENPDVAGFVPLVENQEAAQGKSRVSKNDKRVSSKNGALIKDIHNTELTELQKREKDSSDALRASGTQIDEKPQIGPMTFGEEDLPGYVPEVIEPEAVEPDPPPRPRNELFDAVAQYVFKIGSQERAKLAQDSGRVGILASWLQGKNGGPKRAGQHVGFISTVPTAAAVKKFCTAWEEGEIEGISAGTNLPLDIVKFSEHWRAWWSHRPNPAAPAVDTEWQPPVEDVWVPPTGADLEAVLADLEAVKNGTYVRKGLPGIEPLPTQGAGNKTVPFPSGGRPGRTGTQRTGHR